MRLFLIIIALLAVLLPAVSPAVADQPRVLFLSSYHPTFPSLPDQISGLKQALEKSGATLDVEFMDSKRFHDDTNIANFTTLLRYKLQHSPPYDVLVVGDDNALNYAIKHKDTLFAKLPIVFLAINDVGNALLLAKRHGITGVLESVSLNETLNLMHQVATGLKKTVVITDATPSGQGDLASLKQAMQVRGEGFYTILDLSETTWQAIPAQLQALDPHDAILLLSAYRDHAGTVKSFRDGLQVLLKNAPCPIFHLWAHGIGDGILGGKVISFTEQGRLAGGLALRIIHGEEPALISVIGGGKANVVLFDRDVMQRFGIDRDRLPKNTVLLNDKPPFPSLDHSLLLNIGILILGLVLVISYLLSVNRKRARAERRARQSENRYRTYIDNAPNAVIITDSHGIVLRANKATAELTGYDLDELPGMPLIETLMPDNLQAEATRRFFELRTEDSVNSLEILRKDGKTAFILFDAVPLDDATFVIFCKDMTELRKAHDAMTASEALFHGLLEQAGDAIFVSDISGQILFVNQAACASLGYSREELEKLRIWDVDPQAVERNDQKHCWGKQHMTVETLHKRMDGTTFPVEVKLGTIQVGGKDIVLALARDITVRKKREERIKRESEINLSQAEIVRSLTAPSATLQTVAEVVFAWAKRITTAQFAYVGSVETPDNNLHIYNITAMQGDGCRVDKPDLIFPIRNGKYPSLWGHSLNTGQPFFTNKAANHPSSRGVPEGHIPVEQFLSMPCRYEGELVGQIGIAHPSRDFTDQDVQAVEVLAGLFALAIYRKRAESELIQAKETAEAASRSKSEFLANVSHELRTPINGVFTMLKLAQETDMSQEQAGYVEAAIVSGRNLLQVVNDVLDLSKIEAGKIEIMESLFFPRELMESMASIFRLQAEDKGLELHWEVRDKVDEAYVGDQGRIRQILFNLVGNALKFTETGSISIFCDSVSPSEKAYGQILFEVRDTGIGIPENKIHSIFKTFEQVDGSYSRRYQGAGLGLGIVKRFVELMHGHVTVDSVFGQGSTFSVTVRVHKIQAKHTPPPIEKKPPRETAAGLHLLLAEDERINRLAAGSLLKKRGYEVDAVENGHRVLEALEKNNYDCILMDIQMPGMDGMEATKTIRALPENNPKRNIPIIALTAHAMAGDRERFLDAGMNDYLSKPMDIDALEILLAQITSKD